MNNIQDELISDLLKTIDETGCSDQEYIRQLRQLKSYVSAIIEQGLAAKQPAASSMQVITETAINANKTTNNGIN